MQFIRRASLLVLLAGLCSTISIQRGSAQTVPVTFDNVGGNTGVVSITYFNGVGNSPITQSVYAGDYDLHFVTASNKTVNFSGYCTDLWTDIGGGSTWNAFLSKTTNPTYGLRGVLLQGSNNPYPAPAPQNIDAIAYIAQNYAANGASSEDAQLAIWDLVTGSKVTQSGAPGHYSYGFGDGFQVNGWSQSQIAGIYAIEQAGLTDANSSNDMSDFLLVDRPAGYQGQDFAFNGTGIPGFTSSTPEPSQLLVVGLLATALGGLALRAGRRNAGRVLHG